MHAHVESKAPTGGTGISGWRNEDMFIHSADKEALIRRRGDRVAALFFWPELDNLFTQYEMLALPKRRIAWGLGVITVLIGTVGLCLAAIAPMFPGDAGRIMGAMAAVFTVLVIAVAIVIASRDKYRREWLGARLVTERLRQLKYQFILSNFRLAVEYASSDQEAEEEWGKLSQTAISTFRATYISADRDPLGRVLDDVVEDETWQVAKPLSLRKKADLDDSVVNSILDECAMSRLGRQHDYASLKSGPKVNVARVRAKVCAQVRAIVIIILVLAGMLAGTSMWFQGPTHVLTAWGLVIASCSAAITAAVSVIESGLALQLDSYRYRWYKITVERLKFRMSQTNSAQRRLDVLADLEEAAYEEMREFFRAHATARFLLA